MMPVLFIVAAIVVFLFGAWLYNRRNRPTVGPEIPRVFRKVIAVNGLIAGGLSQKIEVTTFGNPGVLRPRRFIVEPNCSIHFDVQDIVINGASQFAANTGVPAQVFLPSAYHAEIAFDCIKTGEPFFVFVKNNSPTQQMFMGVMFCEEAVI